MKHLKTYENFLKKVGNKILRYLEPKGDTRILTGLFNSYEKEELLKLGFKFDTLTKNHDKLTYQSSTSDINIEVTKYFEEEFPGYANNIYEIKVNGELIEVKNFDDLLQKVKVLIPQVEVDSSKYNL